MKISTVCTALAFAAPVFLMTTASLAKEGKGTAVSINPAEVDADFAIQGEYTGTVQSEDGQEKLGVQIIALGNGNFRAVGFTGGLPGDGWDQGDKEEAEAAAVDGAVTFKGQRGTGTVKDGVMKVMNPDGKHIGDLQRVVRESPTLGAKPPEGASVLFDGTSVDQWVAARGKGPARMTDDGLLMQGANSKKRLGSHHLHIEFLLPYKPLARGQGRGNSGLYLQGRYEVQMLDSFGLAGRDNECGGIYKIASPSINMCFPPLSWQTYDVDFTEAEYDASGKKTKNARMTVRHNGVVIHDDVELPNRTTASPLAEGPEPGFVHLQDHGNPVRYRNIWVVEK
jgi:hypothetical protein